MSYYQYDAVSIAALIGQMTGNTDLASRAINGDFTAHESVPLMAGIMTGAVREVFCPVTRSHIEEEFNYPDEKPELIVRLKNGEKLKVTIEVVTDGP